MSQVKNGMRDPLKHSAPLFGSSWVALFLLLRDSLIGNEQALATAEPPGGNDQGTRH